jgi:diguanylate cyclase (GGDEF)-like protein
MPSQTPAQDQVVLHVEDSDDFAALVGALMEESEFEMHHTRTLAEGEQAASQASYACAFVDLELPDARGLQAVMGLRSVAPGLPLVVLSGQETSTAPVKAVLLGAQDWVGKHEVTSERLVQAVQLAIARQDTQSRAVWLAAHDDVTGLPNRALALEHLTRALGRASRRPTQVAVLFCDLDRFKTINDELGHAAGDSLLAMVAHRMITSVRPGDVVGRWGGDEFVIIAEGIEDPEQAIAIGERIRSDVNKPIALHNAEHVPVVTAGIALASGGGTAHGLIALADQAMLEAKRAGAGIHLSGA